MTAPRPSAEPLAQPSEAQSDGVGLENHETSSAPTRNPAFAFAPAGPVASAQPGANGSGSPMASSTRDSDSEYEIDGNVVRVRQWQPAPLIEPAKPEPKPKAKAKAKPKGKKARFKENTGSLPKSWFPAKIRGATGWFDPVANGQGWIIRFRDSKSLTENSDEKSFQFPRISQETYLTLRGMKSDAERKEFIRDYVRGNLIAAVKRGNDRARAVAARLALKSRDSVEVCGQGRSR